MSSAAIFQRGRRFIMLVVMLASLVACQRGGEISSDYFPLHEDLIWKYAVLTETPYLSEEVELRITNVGISEFNDEEYYVRKTSTGNYYYLQPRDDGIVRVTKRTVFESYPRRDVAERYVLKYPLQPGTQWSHVTKPYLLDRPFPTNGSLKEVINYQLDWEIVGDNETVLVPAGQFENCLHVRGYAWIKVPYSLGFDKDDVFFETNEWYAPGVGLVKILHSEKVESTQAYGGTITMVLESFDH